MESAAPPSPVDSATVVVLRELPGAAIEVLLVQRHAESRAFGGAHVFPGGRVDAADAAAELAALSALTAAEAAERLGEGTPPAAALAYWIAAVRELYEEAGILLATVGGVPLGEASPDAVARAREQRAALIAGRTTFGDVVAREDLRLDTASLHYFSRWITPLHAPRRYDTRFFVTLLPPGQEPLHDRRETTAADWFTPAAALAGAHAGTLFLTPPTMRTLEDLAELGSWPRIRAAASHAVPAILPKVVEIAGATTILYPGDAAYEGALPGTLFAEEPSGPRNRVVMDAGGWRSVRSARR
jgi:8-oxo-dGTP pyrophosphatase MutT (NUDIX family)